MHPLPTGWLDAARQPPPPADRGGDFDFWDAAHGCWAQTWADNHGNVSQLTGGRRASTGRCAG